MSRQNIINKSHPPKSQWFGAKYRVTPETSELLQLEVFKAGGKWSHLERLGKPQTIIHAAAEFIKVSDEGYLLCTEEEHLYKDWVEIETTLEVVKTVQIKEIIHAKTEKQLQKEEILRKIDELKIDLEKLDT